MSELQRQLGLTPEEAKQAVAKWRQAYPRIAKLLDNKPRFTSVVSRLNLAETLRAIQLHRSEDLADGELALRVFHVDHENPAFSPFRSWRILPGQSSLDTPL